MINRPPHPAELAAQRERRSVSTHMRNTIREFLLYALLLAMILAICILMNDPRAQMQNTEFNTLFTFTAEVRTYD